METVTIATIAVFAFLLVFVIIGWYKGFLRIILTTLSLVVTLIAAAFLLNPVVTYLTENTGLERAIEARVEKGLGWEQEENTEESSSGLDIRKLIEMLRAYGIDVPEDADAEDLQEMLALAEASGQIDEETTEEIENGLLSQLKLPAIIKNSFIKKNTISEYIRMGVQNFKQYIVRSISTVALKIMTYIALVIAIYILIRILLLLTKVIEHVPIVRGINRFFGAVVGFIEGALFLWLLCLVISLLAHSEFGGQVVDVIYQSRFLSYIYEQNLVLRLVDSFFALF